MPIYSGSVTQKGQIAKYLSFLEGSQSHYFSQYRFYFRLKNEKRATRFQDGRLAQELRSSAGDNPQPSKLTGTINGHIHCHHIATDLLHSTRMPWRRKNSQQPQKLLSYFTTALHRLQKKWRRRSWPTAWLQGQSAKQHQRDAVNIIPHRQAA